MKKKKNVKKLRISGQFSAVNGKISDAEAALFGPTLVDLAIRQQVDDIRNLDARALYEDVKEKGEDHPCYSFVFNNSNAAAATEYRIGRCRTLIGSICINEVGAIKSTVVPKRLFVAADVKRLRESGKPRVSSGYVMRDDVKSHPAAYISAIHRSIRCVTGSFRALQSTVSIRKDPPAGVSELVGTIAKALADYQAV